jgi:hypothetical protein
MVSGVKRYQPSRKFPAKSEFAILFWSGQIGKAKTTNNQLT